MFNRVTYRDDVTGVQRTETARVINVGPEKVTLRSLTGWKYTRPTDHVETIDGKPAA